MLRWYGFHMAVVYWAIVLVLDVSNGQHDGGVLPMTKWSKLLSGMHVLFRHTPRRSRISRMAMTAEDELKDAVKRMKQEGSKSDRILTIVFDTLKPYTTHQLEVPTEPDEVAVVPLNMPHDSKIKVQPAAPLHLGGITDYLPWGTQHEDEPSGSRGSPASQGTRNFPVFGPGRGVPSGRFPPAAAKVFVNISNCGRAPCQRQNVVVSPGMSTFTALTAAKTRHMSIHPGAPNPFAFEVALSSSLKCFVIDEVEGIQNNATHKWELSIYNRHGQKIVNGKCIPKDVVILPGFSIWMSLVRSAPPLPGSVHLD